MAKAKAKKVKIQLIKSYIGSKPNQRKTALAMGLRKINQTLEVELSPSIQGMIDTIKHLVKVEEIK